MYTYISQSENDTMSFAQLLAKQTSLGDIIILSGDLGSGKTKFVQGFLKYYGLENEISSPTFTIVNEYPSVPPLFHFDVYRLADVDEFYAIGGEEYFEKGICLIEWGELLEPVLPNSYLKITFSRNLEDENKRVLTLIPHGEHFNHILAFLLTAKPILYIANVSEEQLGNVEQDENVKKVQEYAKQENTQAIPLCVKIEEELTILEPEDKKEMLKELGLDESGLDKVIKASYDLLGLMSFLTAGEPEVRAWTIKKGTKAPEAAGKIHSDIQRGFIKAEIVSYDDLMKEGSMVAAREKGLVRQEGKDYIMQEGDIVLFKFNV